MTLTAASVKRSLQIANCCAAKKGADYLKGLEKGQKYDDLLFEANSMVNLIDALKGFIPAGELLSGEQAFVTHTVDITKAAISGTATVIIFVPVVLTELARYDYVYVGTDPNDLSNQLVDYINSFYPQNYPYQATKTSGSSSFSIYGTDFDASNNMLVSFNKGSGILDVETFAEGTTAVYQLQEDNCITNAQAETIVEKLEKLCNCDCSDVVNFTGATDQADMIYDETEVFKLATENKKEILIPE